MSSDRLDPKQNGPARPRVIKAHEVAGLRHSFPALEQVAPGDLPPSLITAPAQIEPAIPPAQALEGQRLLEGAREAEARARALERRAVAVLEEAEAAAAARLGEAEAHVAAMLARATEAAELIHATAREEGFSAGQAEGYSQGLEAGQAEADRLLAIARAEAEALVEEARHDAEASQEAALTDRRQWLENTREQVLDLAVAMARQVLKTELALRPEAMLPMLEAALARLKGEVEPEARVSPAVLALLEAERGRLLAAAPGARRLNLEPDPSLAPGDFLLQGSQGFVDGRIDRQVDVLDDKIRDEEGQER